MPVKHIFLLLLVVLIWGLNFVAVKIGLQEIPPLTFAALRFLAAAIPAVFFVKKPDVPLPKLAAFGLLMFAGQFALLFSGMHAGLSAGLASLVLQVQAFFTIGFAMLLLKEKPLLFQIIGTVVGACGIILVGFHTGGDVTLTGLTLAIAAAVSWAAGNVLTKTLGKVDMFGVVVWGSLFALPPLAILAVTMEGPDVLRRSISTAHAATWWSLAYIVYLSTFVGYTLWNKMLARYSAGAVAPFTLLVPACGMLGAPFMLNETYPSWKFMATLLIIAGLCLNQFGERLQKRFFGRA